MKRIRVIPVLLLQNGGLVKTVRFKSPTYIGDPINAVKIYNEKEVDEIVILDISATPQSKRPDFNKIKEIASEAFMPFAYGGGIKTIEDIREIYNCGVEKIILNSQAFINPKLIEEATKIYGSQSIVVSIDTRKNLLGNYKVIISCGSVQTSISPVEFAKKVSDHGAGEIILTSINCEGTFKGYDLELIERVASKVPIPLVANGGAASLEDFYKAIHKGASAVAAGSMFVYHGKTHGILINYPSQDTLMSELYNKFHYVD